MFSLAPLVTLAVAALSVSALPVPTRNHKTISARAAPAGWHVDYLENYDVYHERYIALSCQGRHGDAFFESCCHPLLATETLEGNREAQCNPANLPAASSAAVEVAPTTTAAPASTTSAAVEEDDEECEVEESSSAPAWTAAATTAAAPAETTAAAQTTTAAEVKAAVAPTTTAYVAPAATTTKAAPAATTTKAASTSSWKTGGFATYFYQNGNPGACGNYNPDSLPLVAITSEYYGGDSGSASSNCGKYVNIERTDGSGRSVTAIVADLCPTCVNGNSLDLSVGAFTSIADEAEGMIDIKWTWA